MKKVYLINEYDRYCPENNNGDYFIAAFSTRELAEAFVKKYDGDKTEPEGLYIREFNVDEYDEYNEYRAYDYRLTDDDLDSY